MYGGNTTVSTDQSNRNTLSSRAACACMETALLTKCTCCIISSSKQCGRNIETYVDINIIIRPCARFCSLKLETTKEAFNHFIFFSELKN